jgi:hypothetical protein
MGLAPKCTKPMLKNVMFIHETHECLSEMGWERKDLVNDTKNREKVG